MQLDRSFCTESIAMAEELGELKAALQTKHKESEALMVMHENAMNENAARAKAAKRKAAADLDRAATQAATRLRAEQLARADDSRKSAVACILSEILGQVELQAVGA